MMFQIFNLLLRNSKLCKNNLVRNVCSSVVVEKNYHKENGTIPTKTLQDLRNDMESNYLKIKESVTRMNVTDIFKLVKAYHKTLEPKQMKDSYERILLPLSSDSELREKYMSLSGKFRVGRLLEDLDVFGGYIAYKHINNAKKSGELPTPIGLVTALVDHIDFQACKEIDLKSDIILEGHVSWVGTSSMQATMDVLQKSGKGFEKVTEALFVFAARNPLLSEKVNINPLICKTEEEKALFAAGEKRKAERKKLEDRDLFKNPPSESEKSLVHELLIKMADPQQFSYSLKNVPQNSKWMKDSKLKNVILCFYEHRNLFKKIFGGFIMREAFELAYANASVYSGQQPTILFIDDILFRRPVEIGSLLYLSSQVVYTEGCQMQISTKASVYDVSTRTSEVTNVFHFTFQVPKPVSICLPHSYQEAMMYIDGRRRHNLIIRK